MDENIDITEATESNLALPILFSILNIGNLKVLNSSCKCNVIFNAESGYNIALNRNDINQLINELFELKKKMAAK